MLTVCLILFVCRGYYGKGWTYRGDAVSWCWSWGQSASWSRAWILRPRRTISTPQRIRTWNFFCLVFAKAGVAQRAGIFATTDLVDWLIDWTIYWLIHPLIDWSIELIYAHALVRLIDWLIELIYAHWLVRLIDWLIMMGWAFVMDVDSQVRTQVLWY